MQNKITFNDLKKHLAKKLEPSAIKAQLNDWYFYIDSTDANMRNSQEAWNEYYEIFKDESLYKKFQKIDAADLTKRENKQLKDILKSFDEELNSGDLKRALRDQEAEIAKKFNSYVYKIGEQIISKTELIQILQTETDLEIRKAAYKTKVEAGDLIAQDLIDFVKLRNEYAKTKGYQNYFEYKLKEDYDVDTYFLKNLIDDVYLKAKDLIKNIQEKKYNELKQFFGVQTLKNYHLGYLLDTNPEKKVNEILKDKNIEDIAKKYYFSMGYDLDKFIKEGKLTLDLYPRKNKNTHGFCFGIQPGKDSRILANLINNVTSLDTLSHELGHCVYDLGISTKLDYFDREPSSSAFTEAIAMMMGDIIKKENPLKNIVSQDLFKDFQNTHKEDEANFIARSLLIIDFERELYKNPEQNPKILWNNIREKYLNIRDDENNEWATIPHYLSHPAYYQNYFRATIMKAQIYAHLKEKLGFITENKKSADYLNNNIFKYGSSVEEYDLIKQLTGKEFSVDDFVKTLY